MTATLKILQYPHKALRETTLPVTVFDDALRQYVHEMFALMYEDEAVGLASTQVGLTYRLFIMDVSPQQNQPQCFINPEIIETTGTKLYEEGCASFPGVYAKVLRADNIIVKYFDEFGVQKEQSANGLAANCIQHEIDHINGILFIDRLSKLKKMMMLKKYEKLHRVTDS
jgi:peptide deformylase